MSKNDQVAITADWMHKRDLPAVQRIEESNEAWEGWSEKDFIGRLRQKNVIGMVSRILDVVGAFVIYELREKELFFLKFQVAKELETTQVGHILLLEMKRKAEKYHKKVTNVVWEGESIEKMKFFAKEGFSSRIKRDFFLPQHIFSPDGVEFTWNFEKNRGETPFYAD